MNPNYIKPIPKRIERQILNYDAQHNTYTGLRFYAYLTTIQKELVKVTVAIRNKGKKTQLIKQVAIHGVYSDKCLVRDIEYGFMGNYRVGWYDEGIKYPYNMRPFYNDGIWYAVDFKYYNPWTHVINPQFAISLSQFRYSAVNIQNPPCIITYLRTYLKYPQAEYLVKAGLGKYVGSTMILKKIGSDKGFRKWLMAHREELRAHHYYVDVVLRAYRTGKPLELLQSYREAKINLRNTNMIAPIRELFTGIERERFFDYISEQDTNVNTYLDYLKACQYLGLDMSLPKNRFPHNFKYWHDMRIDQYATARAEADRKAKQELYERFTAIAEKYLPLEHAFCPRRIAHLLCPYKRATGYAVRNTRIFSPQSQNSAMLRRTRPQAERGRFTLRQQSLATLRQPYRQKTCRLTGGNTYGKLFQNNRLSSAERCLRRPRQQRNVRRHLAVQFLPRTERLQNNRGRERTEIP